jgi:hypothetical protein
MEEGEKCITFRAPLNMNSDELGRKTVFKLLESKASFSDEF